MCEFCGQTLLMQWSLNQFMRFQKIMPTYICQTCRDQFSRIVGETCQECGKKCQDQYCMDCQNWLSAGFPPLQNQALYEYNDAMKEFFKRYKFQGGYHLKTIFQTEIEQQLQIISPDLIIPIPITLETQAIRCFNQVSAWLEKCVINEVLTCVAETKQVQSTKTRQQRLTTAQPFKVIDPECTFENKTICLVDDVYTTGRTLRHAAACLFERGATHVQSLTLAR